MRKEENICQYCTRQREITTLSLNTYWNQMNLERSCLLIVLSLLILGEIWCWFYAKTQKQKLQVLTLPCYISKHLTALHFYNLIRTFCTQFICLVFDGLLESICFRMFCFKNTYLLSCCCHCVEIFYIKFRFCETFTVTNFVTRILLIETLFNFRTIKCCVTLYLHMYHACFRLV